MMYEIMVYSPYGIFFKLTFYNICKIILCSIYIHIILDLVSFSLKVEISLRTSLHFRYHFRIISIYSHCNYIVIYYTAIPRLTTYVQNPVIYSLLYFPYLLYVYNTCYNIMYHQYSSVL